MLAYWVSPLLDIFLVDVGIQWVGWVAAVALKTEKFYDLTGSITFLGSAALSYLWNDGTPSLRQTVQIGLVSVWALRLGYHLVSRIMRDGRDTRFDDAKQKPLLFLVYWTLQGFWVWITLAPTLVMLTHVEPDFYVVSIANVVGWTVWIVGFAVESIADRQKVVFRRQPENAGRFISTGLWALSRHPNYLGEIVLWIGAYISAAGSFTSAVEHWAVLSPIFIYCLITQVSGVPLLEKSGHARWGEDADYKAYIRNTPVLVPGVRCFCLP